MLKLVLAIAAHVRIQHYPNSTAPNDSPACDFPALRQHGQQARIPQTLNPEVCRGRCGLQRQPWGLDKAMAPRSAGPPKGAQGEGPDESTQTTTLSFGAWNRARIPRVRSVSHSVRPCLLA